MRFHLLVPALGCLAGALIPLFGQERDPQLIPEPRDLVPLPDRDPPREPEKVLHFQVEFISMDHKTLTELLFMRDPQSNAAELRAELQDLAKAGKAELVETMLCVARSGQRAKSEQVREFMYPTEYDPAEIPRTIHFGDGPPKDDGNKETRIMTPPHPTAFEVRNEGSTLEVDAVLGQDGTIHASIAPEMVEHTGNSIWMELLGPRGEVNTVEMPNFYTVTFSTSLVMHDGHYTVAGLASPRDQDGKVDRSRKILAFAKCDIVPVKK